MPSCSVSDGLKKEYKKMSSSISKTLGYLPNLCTPKVLVRTLVAALLLAFILALIVTRDFSGFFSQFGLHALFTLWVALASLITICMINRFYAPSNTNVATFIVTGTVLLFTIMASWMGAMLLKPDGGLELLFVLRNLLVSLVMTLALLRYFYMQGKWEASIEANSSAKYEALQSRMRPHFLFNSLNTVAFLVHKDPDTAEDAILDLADIMRTTLDRRNRISLQEELDVTMRYLRMEALRLGKRRLTIVWDMDRNTLPFDMEILPLILQPLAENAIYHGIQPRKDGGTLTISLYDAGDHLAISVTNPLPPEGISTHQKGNHIAQENMKNRLQLAYGGRANLQIQKLPQQYRVSFSIPKE